MARAGRLAVPVALLAFLTAVPTAQGAPAVAKIFHTEKLPIRQGGGALYSFKVTCPPGYRATAGSTYPLPLDVKLLKSASSGASRIFLFEPAGYGETQVTVVVTCVKRRLLIVKKRPFYVSIKTATAPAVRPTPNVPVKTKVTCPPDTAPAGSGLSIGTAGEKHRTLAFAAATPDIQVFESMPVRGGWQFGLRQSGGPAAEVQASVTCISRKARTRKRRHRKRRHRTVTVLRAGRAESVPPGDHLFEHGCSRRSAELATGFSAHPEAKVQLVATHLNDGGRAFWRWLNSGDATVEVTNYLLCLKGATDRILRR